jgi:two-component system, cell cycle response regulator DivK
MAATLSFVLTLPTFSIAKSVSTDGKRPAVERLDQTQRERKCRGVKILIVDDSKLQRRALQMILEKAGYDSLQAADGKEGLKMARENLPDLILLDMMLPGLDGCAVLDQLKNHPDTSRIPVIVLTGLSQKNEEKLLTAGAIAYFQKPELGLDKGCPDLLELLRQTLPQSRGTIRSQGASA